MLYKIKYVKNDHDSLNYVEWKINWILLNEYLNNDMHINILYISTTIFDKKYILILVYIKFIIIIILFSKKRHIDICNSFEENILSYFIL